MRSAIFDLDGTLVDSAPSVVAALNAALAVEGAAPLGSDAIRGMIGRGAAVLMGDATEAAGLGRKAELEARLLTAFLVEYEAASPLTRLHDGVAEALDRLSAAGWRLGLVTNKSDGPVRSTLHHVGLDGRFEAIVTGDTATRLKPDPAPLRAVQDALGGYPAVYIGDSEVDAAAANAAPMPFLLYTEGYRRTPASSLVHIAEFNCFSVLPELAEAVLTMPASDRMGA